MQERASASPIPSAPRSLGLLPVLAGAVWVHASNSWVLTAPGGGWEYPALLILASVALALLGDGACVMRSGRRIAPEFAAAARC
jgi:putative oxidoreductase